jgi:hypothetical protein
MCSAGLKRCLAAKAAALGSFPSAIFEGPGSGDKDDDLDMLIIDVTAAAQRNKALAWADAVVGYLCASEDARDSILMVLLMPAVCHYTLPQCRLCGSAFAVCF